MTDLKEDSVSGYVFDIERYATGDGPGIRTLIFLKGCPLCCSWCDNPESQVPRPQIIYYRNKCVGCGRCIESCPEGAIQSDEEFGLLTNPERCSLCGLCAESCYAGARSIAGKRMTVGEVLREVEKDRMFYETSGGGVTLSGGEPLAQPQFAAALLAECKRKGFHTALETSGFGPWETLAGLIDYLDLVFYDIKHIDPERHKELTGVDNRVILENLKRLSARFSPIIVRIPFVPGTNDRREDQMLIYRFVSKLKNIAWVEIMPYHRLGLSKYEGLGRKYSLKTVPSADKKDLSYLVKLGNETGIEVRVGST